MISINNISFAYNRTDVFDDLSMNMKGGNIYGLLGLNGAGKTTLLKLLAGLLFPKTGTIQVMEEEPLRRFPQWLSRIFMVPEEFYFPSISEEEYILSYASFYPNFDRKQFEQYRNTLEIPRGKRLHALSYGQKKKFLLSFGLASGCELLILDEPSNGLDIPSKTQLRRLVAESLNDEKIVIISTHQVRDVDTLIDPITILHQGRIVFSQSVAEISEQIHMRQTPTAPAGDAEGLLYTEPVVGSHWSVWKGADKQGGAIDLEILFNAIIANPKALVWNKEGSVV